MTSVGDLLLRRADDDGLALLIGDEQWSYRQLVEQAARRAALFDEIRDPDRPPHVGVLLDNVPDYLFWLSAAALSGAVVVGVNATYRGEQLGQLVRHTDCQLLVTSSGYQPMLEGVNTAVAADRVLVVDGDEYAAR
nr:AMP-binding protein [Micromonospora sp. DSM 115978]